MSIDLRCCGAEDLIASLEPGSVAGVIADQDGATVWAPSAGVQPTLAANREVHYAQWRF